MGDTSTNMNQVDFGFAFNDVDFSDRILRLEIMTDTLDSKFDCESVPNRKRMRESLEEENEDEAANSNDSNCSMAVKVKTFHISSLILAAKSPFFYKLFKNGMRESQERDAILRINASEEASLMELLKYMYNNSLSVTSAPDLLGVLMAADKFEHTPCMKYCLELLKKITMSLELAILCFELLSSVLVGEIVQPLIHLAKCYLASQYKDFIKSQAEAMALPLSAIKVVLKSDGLRVNSEDDVFNFILEWARAHYPKLEERREILTKDLAQLICFPYMSCSELRKVLGCPDFDHEQVSKIVFEALASKIEEPYGQHLCASPSVDLTSTKCSFPRREYNRQLVKVVQFKFPRSRCAVYFDIEIEECYDPYFESGKFYSQPFCLGGRSFTLLVVPRYNVNLFLQMAENSEACTLDCEAAVMDKSSMELVTKKKLKNYTLTCDQELALLHCAWVTYFMPKRRDDDFIDGILHLRFEFALNDSLATV